MEKAVEISVVVVDDEPLIRSGLRAIIDAESDLTVVGEAGDGAEVLPVVRRTRPDVVLMDVRMPAVDGIQATRLLLDGLDPAPRVLVVTTFENDDYVTTRCGPAPRASCSSALPRTTSSRRSARSRAASRCCSPRRSARWLSPT